MKTRVDTPQSRCRVGFARADITPPVGIYHRMWGAALHDRATGVHRPLTATAMRLEQLDGPGRLLVIGLDHCILDGAEIENIRDRRRSAGDIAVSRCRTRTAPAWMSRTRSHLPGGDLIGPYLDRLADVCAALAEEAARTRAAGDDPLRHRALFARGPPRLLGRSRQAIRVRLQPRRTGRRHRSRGESGRGQRRNARNGGELRLPPDDARVGEHAHQPGLRRRDARGDRTRHRRAVPVHSGRVRRPRPARRLRRRRVRSRTATAGNSASRHCPRWKRCPPRARTSSTPARSCRARSSAPGSTAP